LDNIEKLNEADEEDSIINDPDIPFIRGNPFIDRLRNGYSITVHYGPQDKPKPLTYNEMIEDEAQRIKFLLYEKTKDIPPGQELSDRLEELYQAIRSA